MCKWPKLSELRLIPSGHVRLFLMISIEFWKCWEFWLLNDSRAKSPANRAARVRFTVKERAPTMTKHIERNMRTKSMRSANRNFKQIKIIIQNIIYLNRLTSWWKLTSASLLTSISSSFFFLGNHWRHRNILWKMINLFDFFSLKLIVILIILLDWGLLIISIIMIIE